MDQEARNSLQKATQQVRRLLEEEFADQLEGMYDIFRTGEILPQPGQHLDINQLHTRQKLVDAIEHNMAAGKKPNESVDEFIREAAFTFLNRFVALRMLEARDVVQECVSNGDKSGGFKEFCGLSPGLASLSDGGYRLYLECLFDELTVEVKVLFNRRASASLLWPRRAALDELLEILGNSTLTELWGEDETIGWVYQYFNNGEERRKMREESQAPRNSRELAVRNQFFTPRFVVQFLGDNTLGRIWYEMQKGDTLLGQECGYLVHRNGEIFLSDISSHESKLSELNCGMEDMVHVAHRPKKDPRDIKILDPACGSGHFLLYAFDLLVRIYEEAWKKQDDVTAKCTGTTLQEDYPTIDALRRALPGLILRHNLYGVDIDLRAAQIAALALWLRSQRAYKELGVPIQIRPLVRRSNVVCAEPMPGEADLLEEFISNELSATPENRVVAQLVRVAFEAMKLADNIGTLLVTDESIGEAARRAKHQWETQPKEVQQELFSGGHQITQRNLEFDVSGISDAMFWDEIENKIYGAMKRFAKSRVNTFQHQLFAEDAARGFAFIDILQLKYDVVLMNPPFGDPSRPAKSEIVRSFPSSSEDLGAAFVERGVMLLDVGGKLGAITNRTILAVQGFSNWRHEIITKVGLSALVDLGHGVLDAMVETAMYVVGTDTELPSAFIGLLESHDKKADLKRCLNEVSWRKTSEFDPVPGSPIAYWVPAPLLNRFTEYASFLANNGEVCPGTQTSDDFRFYRLRWEVPVEHINYAPHVNDRRFEKTRWSYLAKGGEYALWWDDVHLLQDWAKDGAQIKNFVDAKGKQKSYPKNLDKLFLKGTTYPYRTTSTFGLKLLLPGVAFSLGGWGIFPPAGWSEEEVLAVYNSRVARYFMEVLLGQGDSSASGTAARNHVAKAVGGIPWPRNHPPGQLNEHVSILIDLHAQLNADETSTIYEQLPYSNTSTSTFLELLSRWWEQRCDIWKRIAELHSLVEQAVESAFELSADDLEAIATAEGEKLTSFPKKQISNCDIAPLFQCSTEQLTSRAKESCGAKRYTVKKAYFIDRTIDLACHILKADVHSVIDAARNAGPVDCSAAPFFARVLISSLIGCAVGRFAPDKVTAPKVRPSKRTSLPRQGLMESETDRCIPMWADDAGHAMDFVALVRKQAEDRFGEHSSSVLQDVLSELGSSSSLRTWLAKHFFDLHVSQYSKSRRKAPIYWQLSSKATSYSIWLYYPSLNRDSFFKVLNEFANPKLHHEKRKLEQRRQEVGPEPTRGQRKELEVQEALVSELATFVDEINRIAPLWNPNLNDGVLVNFAALWRLVPHNRSWQSQCKKTWQKLVKGDYDWAHLAMHLWPERVVPKCANDVSLAIAHGVEDSFWEENDRGRFQHREEPQGGWGPVIAELVEQRTSPAVKAALRSLLDAPAPSNGNPRRKRRTART